MTPMRRYVRRGAKASRSWTSPRRAEAPLCFDIADTGTRRSSRPFTPWEINDGNLAEVQLGLRQAFNAEGEWLQASCKTWRATSPEMYFDAHRHDIGGIVEGSLMAGYDEGELRDKLQKAAYASIAYACLVAAAMTLRRTSMRRTSAFLSEWNTPEAVTALGTAVSENT